MRRVRNRYVAEVLDADVDGPSPYVVTRYVPGRTLEDTVRQGGPLRGMALDNLAEGLAEALTAIHAAGVVHRDLKPGNVMLDGDHPVIIDFGIAHVPDATRLTQDRPGDGHPRVPRAGGHRGRRVKRRVGRALLGRHRGVRRHRPAAVRQRHLPDDLLPRARGEGGRSTGSRRTCCRSSPPRCPPTRSPGRPRGGWPDSSACPAARVAAMPEVAATRVEHLPSTRTLTSPPPLAVAAPGAAAGAAAGVARRPGSRTGRPRRPRATWPTCCRPSRPRCRRAPAAGAGRRTAAAAAGGHGRRTGSRRGSACSAWRPGSPRWRSACCSPSRARRSRSR